MSAHPERYKPENYPDLSPYLLVADVRASLAFVQAVFGSSAIHVETNENGDAVHAEVRVGDGIVMIGRQDGYEAMLHVYVRDPKVTFDRAIAAGASVLEPVQTKSDGHQRGGVRDLSGTSWYFSRMMV